MREFSERFGITSFLATKSPDLILIENIWDLIKSRLALCCVTMWADIEILVAQIWSNLVTQEYCKSLHNSISTRINEMIKHNGLRIK